MLNKEEKRISRCLCLQVIYAFELCGEQDLYTFSNGEVDSKSNLITHFINDFSDLFGELGEMQIEYSKKLYNATLINREHIDGLIESKLANWDISRLSLIDKLILRMSISEMFYIDEVPPKVSIAEGVEIAKAFSTNDSSSFVNGILDVIYNNNYKELIQKEKK